MKDADGKVLYVGKAANLKRRVSSYFTRPHDSRIEKLVQDIRKIDFIETGTAIEALIKEAELIKKLEPPFNIREKDDKSFLYIQITSEKFPRVLLVRGKDVEKSGYASEFLKGPFTSASSVREALKIIRRIFPYSIHLSERIGTFKKPCFDYEIGLCPGTCTGEISRTDYLKTIRKIKMFLSGKKEMIIAEIERDMKKKSKALQFEEAEKLKHQLFALKHIQDVALIGREAVLDEEKQGIRIEGYDVSNISGDWATGAMVVFENGEPKKSGYRKFRIRKFGTPNDVGMLKEVLERRLKNDWPLPDLVFVDGGKPQIGAAKQILEEAGLKIPIVGIAKGPTRKKLEFLAYPSTSALKGIDKETFIKVRDEAHRFAIGFHRKIRSEAFK